jgi:hyperosmotically inducible periplasmic protein
MYRISASALCGLVLAAVFLLPGNVLAAQERKADNTTENKQDRNSSQATADQAKNSVTDRELMKNIRHDLIHDKSLSAYGHNVKVIADHGKVTLKGPVHSEDEKRAIEEHARKYAGDGNVANELTVK